MSALTNQTMQRRRWLTVTAIALVALALGLFVALQARHPSIVETPAELLPEKVLSSPIGLASPLAYNSDDSGFAAVSAFVLPIQDRTSLEQIRDAYQGAGARGMRVLQQQIDSDSLLPQQRLDRLQILARLCLYEGDF